MRGQAAAPVVREFSRPGNGVGAESAQAAPTLVFEKALLVRGFMG